MQLISALIICFLLIFLFWFIGHVITKIIQFSEDSQLLTNLINISFGASAFLILINLISTITSSFIWGLVGSGLLLLGVICWQIKDFKEVCLNLKEYFINDNFSKFIQQHTDKYFWISIGLVNFIYGLTAFSSTKLGRFGAGNTHIFNINQIVNDVYPPKDYFLTDLNIRFHFGADILAAIISKFTGFHPELSLDFLTIIFLNLTFLTFLALAVKLTDSNNKINRYLISAGAFLLWGPITQLFSKQPGEIIPDKFLPKINYLTQSRLIDSADWSGAVIHWFFEPSTGLGIFFFLLSIYLTFRFFNGLQDLKYTVVLGIFLSSLAIIDFSKFVLVMLGVLLCVGIKYSQDDKIFSTNLTFLKNLGILLGTAVLLAILYGNCIRFDSNLPPIGELFKISKTAIDPKFGPLSSNTLLFIVYLFGFYQAFKQKHNWTIYLIPFFALSFIIPSFISMPDNSTQKLLISTNMLGIFAVPFTLDFFKKQFDLKEMKLSLFYCLIIFLLSFSTLMFWACGDKEKPLFKLDNVSFSYSGLQNVSISSTGSIKAQEDEEPFIEYLKSKNVKNQAITSENQYAEIFTSNTGLRHLAPPKNINELQVKKEILEELNLNYLSSFSLNTKQWMDKKIKWLYLTPKTLRYMMPPEARTRLLNAYLNKGVKLTLSNKRYDNPADLKELYEIDPKFLTSNKDSKYPTLLEQFLGSTEDKNNIPGYIKQVADCPYFGIYSTKSNDFDGDKIADIAFYDQNSKIWTIIYGKDQKETQVDLATTLFSNYKDSDLFIPVPSDYDGDLKTDIALFNRTTGRWHILKSSDSTALNNESVRWGAAYGELPLVADIDGDGKADYSAYGSGSTNWPTLLSSNSSYYDKSFSSGPIDIPLYSYIDNDKKADYVVYKPQESSFYVYLASCLSEPTGVTCGNLSGNKAIQVAAGGLNSRAISIDFDGDGLSDLATWTPESGTWEIAFAKDFIPAHGGAAQFNFILGMAGDIPMPGDYNGDGKAEIAVYHSGTAELEIHFNTGSKKIDLSKYKNLIPANFIGI